MVVSLESIIGPDAMAGLSNIAQSRKGRLPRFESRPAAGPSRISAKLGSDDGHQIRALRSRSAFAITDTELTLIAAAAIMGLRSRPTKG